jgi:hypothetical protein
MITIIPGANNLKYILSRIMIGVVVLLMIGGLFVVTASGDDYSRYGNRDRDDRGRYEHGRRVYQPYGYRHGYDHGYDHGYRYRDPVYVPPPPSPGISIFFPPIIIR